MSRRDRTPPRRAHKRTKPTVSERPPSPVKVTVVTQPATNAEGQVSLTAETELVKSALMYADEVELLSLGASMMSMVGDFSDGGAEAMVALFGSLDDETLATLMPTRTLPENWRDVLPFVLPLMSSPHAEQLGLDERQRHEFQEGLDASLAQVRSVVEEMRDASGVRELQPALDAGVLKLTRVDPATDFVTSAMLSHVGAASDPTGLLGAWFDLLTERLSNSQNRLLFDRDVGNLAQAMMNEGWINRNEVTLRRAGQAAVGSGLVARLPTFPDAPMDELLDLRKDLQAPLANYRAAVASMSKDLPVAFGGEFSAHIDDLWVSNVDPALAEIRSEVADHRLTREMAHHAAQDIRTYMAAGPALFVGLNSMGGLGELISATAGVALPSGAALVQGLSSRRTARDAVKRHDFFYLYESDRRLRRASRRLQTS